MAENINKHALILVIRAMVRAIRSLSYYDERHPVFARTQREVCAELQKITSGGQTITLANAGSHIVIDAESDPLSSEVCRALAKHMYDRSLIAIRIAGGMSHQDIGHLMRLLAEAPDRVRAGGGIKQMLEDLHVRGLTVMEINFEKFFAGGQSDLRGFVQGDAVVERALMEVLRFKDGGSADDSALKVQINQLSTPESLGGFLDDLISQSDTDVPDDIGSGRPGGMPREQFAEHGADAFLTNQELLRNAGAGGVDIAKSAQVLSDALVRLSPHARLALLQKIAGGDMPATPGVSEAAKSLGQKMDTRVFVDAIVSVLIDGSMDDEMAKAIGNLIRRLRPLEKDREDMLRAIDHSMAQRGRQTEAALWQAMSHRALNGTDLGYLKLHFEDVRPALAHAADRRRKGLVPKFPGDDVLRTNSEDEVNRQAAKVLEKVLNDPGYVGSATIHGARDMITELESQGDTELSTTLLASLLKRAEREETKSRRQKQKSNELNDTRVDATVVDGSGNTLARSVLNQLFSGQNGQARATRLMAAIPGQSTLVGGILLDGIATSSDRAYQEALLQKLAACERDTLQKLADGLESDDVVRATALIRASARTAPVVATALGRRLLVAGDATVKEAILKTVGQLNERRTLELLIVTAGAKGDKSASVLLGIPLADEGKLHQYKLFAIDILGTTRSVYAVPALKAHLLQPTKFFANKAVEELRVAAAHALATNASSEANQVLQSAMNHKKRAIKVAAKRAHAGGLRAA